MDLFTIDPDDGKKIRQAETALSKLKIKKIENSIFISPISQSLDHLFWIDTQIYATKTTEPKEHLLT